MDKRIKESKVAAEKLVKKLEKKYDSVSVIPEFEKNGYVVKSVETTINKLDGLGRSKSTNKAYNKVETYNRWREEAKPYTEKVKKINEKYRKKITSAKTEEERDLLFLDMDEELEDI